MSWGRELRRGEGTFLAVLHLIFEFTVAIKRVIKPLGVVVVIVKLEGGATAQVGVVSSQSIVGVAVQLASHHLVADHLLITDPWKQSLCYTNGKKPRYRFFYRFIAYSPQLYLDKQVTLETRPYENFIINDSRINGGCHFDS